MGNIQHNTDINKSYIWLWISRIILKFYIRLCLVTTKLIGLSIRFTLITVETTSIMTNIFIENHYIFRPHRSSCDDTTPRNFNSYIFWDITPRSPLKVKRRFRGTYGLHLQGRIISRERNQHESRLTFNGLHGVIFQKIVLFINTAVRTSNPT
jgi:hypothetical protein